MAHTDRLEITRQWDAGETGCGRLIVGLKRELRHVRAGELLKVTARDAGAWIDVPVWCHMTGHTLVSEAHPEYVVRKRDDSTQD